MRTHRIWRLSLGAGNSFTFDYDFGWLRKPDLNVPRSLVVLSALTIGFTLLAVYGDTLVAGRPGRMLAVAGMLGVVVVFPTLVTQAIRGDRTDSIFKPS